jgi:hypothetical protein
MDTENPYHKLRTLIYTKHDFAPKGSKERWECNIVKGHVNKSTIKQRFPKATSFQHVIYSKRAVCPHTKEEEISLNKE